MIIKKVLIVDDRNGESGEFHFSPSSNLVVSSGNTQGKSSLLKSIYYGFGLDIKRFPTQWIPSTMSIKLDVYNEKTAEDLYIVRKDKLFYVSDEAKPLNATEYTHWLSGKLGVDLKLTVKATKTTKSISYPSPLISPFYIDQDESWSGRIYKAINELGLYSGIPERIFEYIFNISDDDDQALIERLSRLRADNASNSSKRTSLNEVYLEYVNEEVEIAVIGDSISLNSSNGAIQDLDALTELINKSSDKYRKYKALRIDLQRKLDQRRKTVEEYRDILSMYKGDYRIIETICKHCKSVLTPEQVKTRMEISSNILDLQYVIDVTDKEITETLSKIEKCKTDEETTLAEYQKLSREIAVAPQFETIAEYIDAASTKKSQNEFASMIQKLDYEISKVDAEIKDLKQERAESAKSSAALKDQIETKYFEYVNSLAIIMAGSNVHDRAFGDFSAPKSSGVKDNQVYLGIYLTYMRLISEFGRYQLPFCIDSFIKNETSDNNQDVMFEATDKFFFKIKGQSIFSAIESSVDRYMKNSKNIHRVQIGERLLSDKDFKRHLAEVANIVIA